MLSLVNFETTESVLEVIWDVVVAFYVVKISLIYSVLTFAGWVVSSCLVHQHILNAADGGFTPLESGIINAVIPLLSSFVAAKLVMAYFEAPSAYWFRLAVGAASTLWTVLALAIVTVFSGNAAQCLCTPVAQSSSIPALVGLFVGSLATPAIAMVFHPKPKAAHPQHVAEGFEADRKA